jgi:hypothetical protein
MFKQIIADISALRTQEERVEVLEAMIAGLKAQALNMGSGAAQETNPDTRKWLTMMAVVLPLIVSHLELVKKYLKD